MQWVWISAGVLALALIALGVLLPHLIAQAADKRAAAYQVDLMEKHIAEVRNIYAQMRGWRHDYHNHIQTMQAYVELGQIDRLEPYLRELNGDLDGVERTPEGFHGVQSWPVLAERLLQRSATF